MTDTATSVYDLSLFNELQVEYAERRPPKPAPSYREPQLVSRGEGRARDLLRKFSITEKGLHGQRVLEVGCGNGEVVDALNRVFDCECVGVDIQPYTRWDEAPGVEFDVTDLTSDDTAPLGTFDFIVSYTVWEHIRKPYEALQAAHGLLKPGGQFYLSANLYRGPSASHRTREIHFPYPHLLFTDDVIRAYFESIGEPGKGASWVNKLTYAHYLDFFQEIGFDICKVWYQTADVDMEFYRRFEDVLGRYPLRDLERNFMHAVLRRP